MFESGEAVISAYEHDKADLHASIKARVPQIWVTITDEAGNELEIEEQLEIHLKRSIAVNVTDEHPVKNRGFDETVKFLKAFWRHPISKQKTLVKVSLDHVGNVTVTFAGSPPLRLGRRPADQLAALGKAFQLLEGMDSGKVDYVDLQFDDVIIRRR